MTENKQYVKKVFLVVSTIIVAVTIIVYLFVIYGAFEHRKEMAQFNIGEEIIDIHKGVPRGWAYSILTDPKEVGEVATLGKALAQVDFTLPDLNEKLEGEIQKRSIYFYSREFADKIEPLISQQDETNDIQKVACKPELYSQTASYVILSTSCDAFQGEQYSEIESKLKMELEEFWFKFQ